MGSLLMSPTAQFENTGGYVFISDFTYYSFDGKSSVSFSRINLGKRGDGKFRRLKLLTYKPEPSHCAVLCRVQSYQDQDQKYFELVYEIIW